MAERFVTTDIAKDIDAFARDALRASRDVFHGCVTDVFDSIVNGSPLTGSPGQPVVTGTLKNSWQLQFERPDVAVIGTSVEYAAAVEHGIARSGKPFSDPKTRRDNGKGRAKGRAKFSTVGGYQSVASTVANFDRIVEKNARMLRDGLNVERA